MKSRIMIPTIALTVLSVLPATNHVSEAAANAAIPVLAAPQPISPLGVSRSDTPTFTWKAVAGAAAYDVNLQGTFLNTITAADAGCASSATCTYTSPVKLDDGQKYDWSVRARKAKGSATGPFSATYSFDFASTAAGAWQLLQEGNTNYVSGKWNSVVGMSTSSYRVDAAAGQRPYAVVLTCSDSRVPPEVLFDKGLGEIFVIRVAGNVLAPHELGSIEYALEHLAAKLIVVLGHERCGAVQAAHTLFGTKCTDSTPANICSIVASITPAITAASSTSDYSKLSTTQQIEECIVENIKIVAENLKSGSPVIEEFVATKGIDIIKAKYDLDTGVVTPID